MTQEAPKFDQQTQPDIFTKEQLDQMLQVLALRGGPVFGPNSEKMGEIVAAAWLRHKLELDAIEAKQ